MSQSVAEPEERVYLVSSRDLEDSSTPLGARLRGLITDTAPAGTGDAQQAATEVTAGVARRATDAETTAGANVNAFSNPSRVLALVNAKVAAVKADLLGGAAAAWDTLQELRVAIEAAEESSLISALTTVVGGKLTASQNLADLPDPALARANLGVGNGGGGALGKSLLSYGAEVGGTWNAALLAFQQEAKDLITGGPVSTASYDRAGRVALEIPAGTYRVTSAKGLLGAVAMTQKATGLAIRGAGSSLTNIIFSPAAAAALVRNEFWLDIQFEGITFICETPGSTFMESFSVNQAQDFTWTDCVWLGAWKYGIDLKGNNNDSELRFFGCGTSKMADDGAFLYVAPSDGTGTISDTSDQFLNYWFYAFKHWSTSAPLVKLNRGGHVHCWGVDASDWGAAGGTHLFELLGETHALGVCSLSADAVRVEAKSTNARLLYSEWPMGTVEFTNADWSSQMDTFTYGDIIRIKYSNFTGPTYAFRSCNLAGGLWVSYGSNDWSKQHSIVFDACEIHQRLTPSEFVTYDDSRNANNQTRPRVELRDCHGDNQDPSSATGAAVWDATMGYQYETVVPLKLRSVSVLMPYGVMRSADAAQRVALPIGAMVTGLRVVAPPGSTGEGDGGSWSVTTTDAAPVAIATATVAGALSAGFNQASPAAAPHLCSSRSKATLAVSASNVAGWVKPALLIIEGYW